MLLFIIRNVYLVFLPFPGTGLQKPLEFPSDESDQCVFCYVNEMTFGLPLANLRMRAGHQRRLP